MGKEAILRLKKTVEDERFLRIEGGEGAAITIYKERSYGHILSITVKEEDRRNGIGRELLGTAEQELFDCGIQWMDADYADSVDSLTDFFRENGFAVKPGADVMSIPMSELLSSQLVKKSLRAASPGLEFIPLSNLSFSQWNELVESFKRQHLRIENQDITRLEQDISGVVYDEGQIPRAIVFCSEVGGNLHVDFLFGFEKHMQKYILASLQGMLSALIERDGEVLYSNLTAIAMNKNVPMLMERALDSKKKPRKSGETVYARKKLQGGYDENSELSYEPDTDRRELWRREIRKTPFQANISYKLSWGRMNGRLLGGEEPEEKAEIPMTIHYDKDEDQRKGLIMEDTIRITADNMERFIRHLPPDVGRDIIRPFYRGLAVQKEEEKEPAALMAWVYENLETDDSHKANIIFFHSRDQKAGETLLREYGNEIKNEDVEMSYFWLPAPSDAEEALLFAAGFSMGKKVGVNHFVTMDELEKSLLLKNKAFHSVKSLRDVDDRHFKRGVAKCLYMCNEGRSEDLAYLSRGWYDPDVSGCFFQDGKVAGMLLCHRLSSGDFYIDFVRSMGSDPEIETIYLLRFSLARVQEKYKERPRIVIRLDNQTDIRLAGKLFSKLNDQIVTFGERREL